MFSNKRIIAFIVLLISICIAVYVLFVFIPTTIAQRSYDGAKRIGNDIRNALNFSPEITVNNTVVLQQQTSILELASVSQNFHHQYEWINKWMGSTKKIKITGTFEAKAGFNLQEKFKIIITDEKAVITLPSPKLLSLESKSDIKFMDENGVWNWVRYEDRTNAINAFNNDAKRYAGQASFIEAAKTKLEQQLTKILKSHGKEVEFRYSESLRRDL